MNTAALNTKVHSAFAAAAGLPLNTEGTVTGLRVQTDPTTAAFDLDLYAGQGMVVTVNPTWAAEMPASRLTTSLLVGMDAELFDHSLFV
jgi:hypothetical protein